LTGAAQQVICAAPRTACSTPVSMVPTLGRRTEQVAQHLDDLAV